MIDATYERKILKQILKVFREPEKQQRQCKLLQFVLYGAGALLVGSGYILVREWNLDQRLGVVLGTFGGVAIGIASYLNTALNQWPVLRPHVNQESLEARLNELER